MRALEEFQTRYASLHPEDRIEIVDVFEDQIPALDKPLLEAMGAAKRGEAISPEQAEQLGRYNALTQQFLAADKIVVVNPLWNLNVPSQLVSWINTINVAGLTFKYGPEGSIGLVKGKNCCTSSPMVVFMQVKIQLPNISSLSLSFLDLKTFIRSLSKGNLPIQVSLRLFLKRQWLKLIRFWKAIKNWFLRASFCLSCLIAKE